MSRFAAFIFLAATPAFLGAHPMGNFSVNHYARLNVTTAGVQMDYVLDLAEIPSLELLHSWNLQRDSPRRELEERAASQARIWLTNLKITANNKPLAARFKSASLFIGDGAANLPVMRISARALLTTGGGDLNYEDFNYPDRAGWKEIVITKTGGVTLRFASQTDSDISKALTQYPPDPTLAPPQDLRAQITWMIEPAAPQNVEKNVTSSAPAGTVISPVPQPHRAPAAASPATLTAQAAPPGTVVRGDFLSRLLHRSELAPWMVLLAMVAAFGLGALHALTPGHGKTIVAAYLVGSRGTIKHAAFLGAIVTFTHTISVFALGIATLFFFRYVVPEKLVQVLGVISGISIVAVGFWMARRRLQHFLHLRKHAHAHAHGHSHPHPHSHSHTHAHDHDHSHHGHAHTHSHVPEELSWSGLIALGVGGGLVPCESALVLMLSAIALGRVAFGLLLLLSFSLGLALVLMAVGAAVLYSKKLIGRSTRIHENRAFQWLPLASAAAVIVVGLIMTGVSAGVLRPSWLV